MSGRRPTPSDRLADIASRIEDGTYDPPAVAVADALLYEWTGQATVDAWREAVAQEDPKDAASARSSR